MNTIIILNVLFAALAVGGIVALLSWGIVSNREMVASLSDGGRHRVRGTFVSPFERGRDRLRVRTAHSARPRRRRALDFSA